MVCYVKNPLVETSPKSSIHLFFTSRKVLERQQPPALMRKACYLRLAAG